MGSKRIRFGLSYKGSMPFTADVLGSIDVRCIERVTVGDVHHVLITLGKPRQTACIVKAVNEYNEAKDDKLELDEIVTFTKAQGYMQHPFYAPFDAALKLKVGEDGGFAYSIWNDDNADKKRAAKELEVDMTESSVKPSSEKRARTTVGGGGCACPRCDLDRYFMLTGCGQGTSDECCNTEEEDMFPKAEGGGACEANGWPYHGWLGV
jgi:hypothetical protein